MYFCILNITKRHMQERHLDRHRYFNELSVTSEKYYIPYISGFKDLTPDTKILEIGCGDGGNLLPFARLGCDATGIDISEKRIKDAVEFFKSNNVSAGFIASDIFKTTPKAEYDVIICHDVFEHIPDKEAFIGKMKQYMKDGGIIFMSFPAWHMPFGGHQQICRSRVLSHFAFVHLLPNCLYRRVIRMCGESKAREDELLEIKSTKATIESFERVCRETGTDICDRRLYFINPHYEIKFGLRPRKLNKLLSRIPYVRNYFSTSCFYILK